MIIDIVSADGEPLEPINSVTAFTNQAGVLVRDMIPITCREWKKPRADGISFVSNELKTSIWDKLISHFTLPMMDTEEQTTALKAKVKVWILKKMAKQFQNHKKRTWAKYVKSGKITPEFKGTDERLRDHWDDFVTYKESEEALERSKKNADNAKKKVLHHNLGPGGYKTAMPKWDKLKPEMKAKGLTPETEKVPERAGNFLMAHGMTLEKETGELVLRDPTKKAVLTPFDDLKKAVAEVEAGTFIPDRENDELTKALRNPEKGG